MILVEPDQRWRLMKKRCTRCHQLKTWAEFTPQKYWPDGSVRWVMSSCRLCRATLGRTEKVRTQKREALRLRTAASRREVARQQPSPRLPVQPFRRWLWAEKKRVPLSMIADRSGVSERSLLRVLKDNGQVELDLVDRVLLSSPIRLEDLYSEEDLAA